MNFYFSCFYKVSVFFFLAFLFYPTTTVFSQTIVLEGEKEVSSLGSSLSYFTDSENKGYSIEDINNVSFDKNWTKNPSEHLNLGYLSVPVWLKVTFSNKSQIDDWQFILDMPFTDSIDFYQKNNEGLIKHTQTGWIFPYHSRGEIKNNGFAFPLDISPNEEVICYLRIRSNYPVLLYSYKRTNAPR